MQRTTRARIFDATVGFDDPLEMLLACHRRIERHLQTLTRLSAHLAARGVDADATTAAQSVLRYFMKAAVTHHEDEEKDLFPLLERRISEPTEKARFHAQRDALERDHGEVQALWGRLRKPLEGIAEGLTRVLADADVRAFAAAHTRHILAEEAALKEFFDRWLDDADRVALGRSMSARRSSASPPPF